MSLSCPKPRRPRDVPDLGRALQLDCGPVGQQDDGELEESSRVDVETPGSRSTYVRQASHRQPVGVIEMPRFMGFVRMEEGVGTPPQALFEAMDTYIAEQTE